MEIKALLGTGTEFKGLLTFEGAVRIDGKLEGEVISDDILIVGEKAQISADIKIGTILISGKIKGNIKAFKKVEIQKTGEIIGNIVTPQLIVEEGAVFEGHCEMKKKDKKVSIFPVGKDKNKKKDLIALAAS